MHNYKEEFIEMSNKEEYALVMDSSGSYYSIFNKSYRAIALIEDSKLEEAIIENLLVNGAEVFNSATEFFKKYPPFTPDERKRIAIENMENMKKHIDKEYK